MEKENERLKSPPGGDGGEMTSVDEAMIKFKELEEKWGKYKLSLALEYSSIIDRVAEVTPRANHPRAMDYPLWQSQDKNPAEAILKVCDLADAMLKQHEEHLVKAEGRDE